MPQLDGEVAAQSVQDAVRAGGLRAGGHPIHRDRPRARQGDVDLGGTGQRSDCDPGDRVTLEIGSKRGCNEHAGSRLERKKARIAHLSLYPYPFRSQERCSPAPELKAQPRGAWPDECELQASAPWELSAQNAGSWRSRPVTPRRV